jgi:hypothetical protein
MYFDAYGPFPVAVGPDGKLTAAQKVFWKEVREKCGSYGYDECGLEKSFGCYVFALKTKAGCKPWYVGKTNALTGFYGEIFQKHKLTKYNQIADERNGTPMMFLFPLLTPSGFFSKDRSNFNKKLVDWVEKMLFGLAFKRNPKCANKHSTKFILQCVVSGVYGPTLGRPAHMASQARGMFF